jgi:hypothetical protein
MKKFVSGLRGKTLFSLLLLAALITQYYVFKEGYDSATRKTVIDSIKRQIGLVSSGITKSAVFNPAIWSPAAAPGVNTNARQTGNVRIDSPDVYYRNFAVNYYSSYLTPRIGNHKFKVRNTTEHFCSCHDTLLWNLTADLVIGGSGQSAPNPPSPVDKGGVQGGAFKQLDNNSDVHKSVMKETVLDLNGWITFPDPWAPVSKEVLAIIDTGIDTTLFDSHIYGPLLSSGEAGAINVMPGADSTNYGDDEEVRHGSAVAAIALKSYYERCGQTKNLPRLLVLKALDKNGYGSTFSISCALSYAVRRQVTAINASLGYWGNQDSVLNHYLRLCADAMIPVIAAAGNDTLEHNKSLCWDSVSNRTRLGSDPASSRLFYPACLSIDPNFYVITVTGMSSLINPCRYQFYSSRYVNIGVVNQDPTSPFGKVKTFPADICCGFKVPFISSSYVLDGSSFATPVVSGQLLYEMQGKARNRNPDHWLNMLDLKTTSPSPQAPFTMGGRYIITD